MSAKTLLIYCLLTTAALGLFACDNKTSTTDNATQQSTNTSTTQENTPQTILITHTKGQTVVPAHPERVIVFDTALLDSLSLIGADILGVPQPNIPYPAALAEYKDSKYINVGTLQEPNFEVISAAQPDLIIGSGRADRAYGELSQIAPTITLSVNHANYYESMREVTLTAARLFDREQEAIAEFDKLDTLIDQVKAQTPEAGTALFIMVNGGKISAYGPGSRFGFIFDVLGMKPAAEFNNQGTHGNIISMEFLLQTNPDWIFVLDRETAIGESSDNAAARQVLNNQLVQQTNAFQNDKIVYVDSQSLYLAGGLQTYQDFVNAINQKLSR